jgi:exodeoxyribonuclease-3
MQKQNADFICLQELKAQEADMTPEMHAPDGYQGYFHYAEKKGYSGVGIYTKHKPDNIIIGLGHADIDAEGRYIELQFENLEGKKVSIVSLYLPSGSSGEDRQQVKFSVMERFYPHLEALKASGREVVVCGDWNIAHQEADLKNWKGNKKNSGFLPEERAWMTALLRHDAAVANEAADDIQATGGLVDVYRQLQPTATDDCYTWWSNRGQAWAKNVGWRLDYHLATPALASGARTHAIYKDQRFSDHAPLTVGYDWSLA